MHGRAHEREMMVAGQLAARGIQSRRVLDAMLAVPRHKFVPAEGAVMAYEDRPLPIGLDQTISQPYMVAHMTELLDLVSTDRVLEIVEDVVAELGGSFSAEHGVGLSKLPSMRRRKDPVALEVMRAIKAALDPEGRMNPGKVIPD